MDLTPKRTTCPDGGFCHRACENGCWRVLNAAPLSGVFPRDRWPQALKEITVLDGKPRVEDLF